MEMNKAGSQLLPEAACGGRDVDLWLKHSEAEGSGVSCWEDLVVEEVVDSVNFHLVPDRAETFDSIYYKASVLSSGIKANRTRFMRETMLVLCSKDVGPTYFTRNHGAT